MSTTERPAPKYRHYKPKNLAVVRIDGRDYYLGRYDSPESYAKYHRLLAERYALGSVAKPHTDHQSDLTVNELLLAFVNHAETYYRREDGTPTPELDNLLIAIRPLRELYGHALIQDFGPKSLKAARQSMLEFGLCRRTINQRIARLIRVFRFGVENELVPASILHALEAVESLKKGKSGAKESRRIKPVPSDIVDATLPFMSRQVATMVELQRLTGMRSGEAVLMRGCDLDTSGNVWVYTPRRHKTSDRDKERRIYIGPKAIEVLKPWLRLNVSEYLFQPAESRASFLRDQRRKRKTKVQPSQRDRRVKGRAKKWTPRVHYDSWSYGHAVKGACRKAFPHPTLSQIKRKELTPEQQAELKTWHKSHCWHPHQLRHAAATTIRKMFGVEVSRVICGHSNLSTTELYAETDEAKAIEAVGRIG
jgi:integrase